MVGGAVRRDNAAARAALARRRQRAAQTLKPQGANDDAESSVPNGQTASAANSRHSNLHPPVQEVVPPNALALKRSASAKSTRPPTPGVSHSRPKSTPRNTPPTRQMQKLTVDTTPYSQSNPIRQPEATSPNNKVTPLTRRALEKKKSPTNASILGDATLTTAALTASTFPSSPEKSSAVQHSPRTTIAGTAPTQSSTPQPPPSSNIPRTNVSSKASTTATSHTMTSSPKQALVNSEKASEQASFILNAVTARTRYRSASPKAGSTQSASVPQTQSRLAQQEGLLATSKRRRQALQNRFQHSAPTTVHSTDGSSPQQQHQPPTPASTTMETTIATSQAPVMPSPHVPIKRNTRRSPSPVPRSSPSNLHSLPSKTGPTRPNPTPLKIPPSTTANGRTTVLAEDTAVETTLATEITSENVVNRTDSPLTARLEKLEVTEKRRTDDPLSATRRQHTERQPTSSVIPRRNHRSPNKRMSPRFNRSPRYPNDAHVHINDQNNNSNYNAENSNLPPPSPRHSHKVQHPQAPDLSQPSPQHSHWETGQHRHHQQQIHTSPRLVPSRSRSPSPSRHKTTSPWIERNVSLQMHRPRSSPAPSPSLQIRERSPSPTSLQSKAMQHIRSGQSPVHHDKGSPHRYYSHYPPSNSNHSGRTSPGVERLSAYLLDSSITDMSTIPDVTQHEMMMETPRNANTTSVAATNSEATLGAQPLTTPVKQRENDYYMAPDTYGTPYGNGNSSPTKPQFSNAVENDSTIDDQATLDFGKLQTMDSACLKSGCTILLRSYSSPFTLEAEQTLRDHQQADKYMLAQLTGLGLGREEELLTVQKVVSIARTTASSHNGDSTISSSGVVSTELRRGDTVLLYSAFAKDRALGFRKFVKAGGTASKLELGFFTSTGSKSELWMILDARPDREVLVGRAAVAPKKEHSVSSRGSTKQTLGMPAPVRSGDPILLRNFYNGGILSISENGKLTLLTDSYDRTHNTSEDPTLLGRLQHHDRLYPTANDTFQFVLSSIPPCPPWVANRGMDERIFLTGSYVLQPRRIQRSAEFESALFGNNGPINPVLEAAQRRVQLNENRLSPKTKERILIDEVIGSFLGLEGLHVRLKGTKGHTSCTDHYEFKLFDADGVTFDVGLRHLVEQILPLSTSYVRVRNFISFRHPGYEYGRVMQAFCEALDALLQDYVTFVAQMDQELRKYANSDSLTMKAIYFQITPSLHSMSILEHAIRAVSETKGGALINVLWNLDKRSYMGDTIAKKVLEILLLKSSVPYMDMMSAWLRNGTLNDPYEEFMIRRSRNTGRHVSMDGDSWFDIFRVNEEHVVHAVVSNEWTKEMIVTTGKYWNAAHECNRDASVPMPSNNSEIPKLHINSDTSAIASFIDSMYQSASQLLVSIMIQKFHLIECLQTMKRYFLLDQGDVLMHFLDAAESELLKKDTEVSMGRVQHWLSMSIQQVESHRDEYDPISGVRLNPIACPLPPSALRCRFAEESLVAYLDSLYGGGIADQRLITPSRRVYGASDKGNSGIEVFTIDFLNVPFPISLVLSPKVMENYKLLFRHLFFAKHVERRLIGIWRDNQLLKKLDSLRGLLGPTFLLRQRMLHFVQNLIYYMVFEVIENQWTDMLTAIEKTGSFESGRPQAVDDILHVHNQFLQKTLEACLLTNRNLIRSLTKLLNTCLLFTDQMKRFMATTRIYDDSLSRAAQKRGDVQRNLNERGSSQVAMDKRALRRALVSTKEERHTIYNRQTRRVGREVSSESYQRMIQRFDAVFNEDLADFITQLNSHATSGIVANLAIRLDYNGFVTASMAKTGNASKLNF